MGLPHWPSKANKGHDVMLWMAPKLSRALISAEVHSHPISMGVKLPDPSTTENYCYKFRTPTLDAANGLKNIWEVVPRLQVKRVTSFTFLNNTFA